MRVLSTAGRWAFRAGAVTVALISLRFLAAPLSAVMPHMAHYVQLVPLGLFGHLFGGPLALALAPLQLWERLRRRRPALHRATGYLYAGSVLVATLGSLALLPHFLGSTWALTGFAVLAILWIGFTTQGILRARARDFAGHRRWMVRSVALSFGAVTLRLIMGPLMARGWTVVETYQITAWGSWVINLAFAEWWLRRPATVAARVRSGG